MPSEKVVFGKDGRYSFTTSAKTMEVKAPENPKTGASASQPPTRSLNDLMRKATAQTKQNTCKGSSVEPLSIKSKDSSIQPLSIKSNKFSTVKTDVRPSEEPQVEETKVEESKVEEPEVEETKVEESKVEETKVEETKVEEPKVEETKFEEIVDEPKIDEPKVAEIVDEPNEEPVTEEDGLDSKTEALQSSENKLDTAESPQGEEVVAVEEIAGVTDAGVTDAGVTDAEDKTAEAVIPSEDSESDPKRTEFKMNSLNTPANYSGTEISNMSEKVEASMDLSSSEKSDNSVSPKKKPSFAELQRMSLEKLSAKANSKETDKKLIAEADIEKPVVEEKSAPEDKPVEEKSVSEDKPAENVVKHFNIVSADEILAKTSGVATISDLPLEVLTWISDSICEYSKHPTAIFESSIIKGIRVYAANAAKGKTDQIYVAIGTIEDVCAVAYSPSKKTLRDVSNQLSISGSCVVLAGKPLASYAQRNSRVIEL